MTKKQLTESKIVEREIPEVGKIYLRLLTAGEVFELGKDKGSAREETLSRIASCVCDGDGAALFGSADEVAGMAWTSVTAISKAILAVNGLDGSAKKNSPAPSGSE